MHAMSMYITSEEVNKVIDKSGIKSFVQTSLDNVEKGLLDFHQGKIQHEKRTGFLFDGNTIESMPARRVGKLIVFKIVNFHKQLPGIDIPSVMSTTVCLDEKTGSPIAIIDSTRLTAIRTGVISGIAIKYTHPQAKNIGLIGAGASGISSLQAASLVTKPQSIYVHDPNSASISKLKNELKSFTDSPIISTDIKDIVKRSDVIIACTYGDEIVIKDDWIDRDKKTAIIAVGADTPGKSELDPELYKRASIVTDFKEQAVAEGDIEVPIKKGFISHEDISRELHELVAGEKIEQKPLTIVDLTGDPISDLIMAEKFL